MANIIIRSGTKKIKRDCDQLEARVCYILMKAGVIGPDIDACVLWAFGPEAWYVPIWPDWAARWHKLHPKQFRVKPNESFVEFLYVVGFLFRVKKYGALKELKK